MSAMEVTRMNENTMKFINPWLRLVSSIVQELGKVNLEGEFVSIIDLVMNRLGTGNKAGIPKYVP